MKAALSFSALLVGCLVAPALNAAENNGSIVAVIDVAKVFENHTAFKSRMDAIKAEVEAFDQELKAKQNELRGQVAELQALRTGSAEYKNLEKTLAQKDADLQIQASQKRKEVLDKEAAVYFETYTQVKDAVQQIAEANGITLVIRFDSSAIDASDRASVIKGVNRNVVLNLGYDLTEMVTDMCNRQSAAAGPSNTRR